MGHKLTLTFENGVQVTGTAAEIRELLGPANQELTTTKPRLKKVRTRRSVYKGKPTQISKILEAIETMGGNWFRPKDIARRTRMNSTRVSVRLSAMSADGTLAQRRIAGTTVLKEYKLN